MQPVMNRLMIFCALALSFAQQCASAEGPPGCMSADAAAQTVIDSYGHIAPLAPLGHLPGHMQRWPAQVFYKVWLIDVADVDAAAGTFTMDVYVNAEWVDAALSYEHTGPCGLNATLAANQLADARIWLPDVVAADAVGVRVMKSPLSNAFAMLYPNGTVWLNYRARVKAPCAPSHGAYPFDTLACGITLRSAAHPIGELRLRWWQWGSGAYAIKAIRLPEYDIVEISTDEVETRTPLGTWSGLRMELALRRRCLSQLVRYYAPTWIIVIVSWLQLCLGPRPLAGRAFVAVGALFALVMVVLTEGLALAVAKAPGIRALDVWLWGCVLFALANVAQLCVVGWLVGRSVAHSAAGGYTEMDKVLLYERCRKALCIDKVCVFLMPAVFVFFNLFYWTVY